MEHKSGLKLKIREGEIGTCSRKARFLYVLNSDEFSLKAQISDWVVHEARRSGSVRVKYKCWYGMNWKFFAISWTLPINATIFLRNPVRLPDCLSREQQDYQLWRTFSRNFSIGCLYLAKSAGMKAISGARSMSPSWSITFVAAWWVLCWIFF